MKRIFAFTLAVVLLCSAQPAEASGSASVIKVMTRNQYLGADLTPVIVARTPQEFLSAATAALKQIAANDFPRRAKALAAEVFLTRPDVIGLQEVFDFTVNGRHTGPPFVDHLQLTLDALAALGLNYVAAARIENADVSVPLDVNGDSIADVVRILDRDVILVKSGLAFSRLGGSYLGGGLCGVPVPNPAPIPPFPGSFQSTPSQDGCTYTVVGVVNSPAGLLTVKRGFIGVDMTVGGKAYRVVNTHLEVLQPDPSNPNSAIIQFLQSVELAGTLHATTPAGRTLIALGDFNSSPVNTPVGPIAPPYQVMIAAGFADSWLTNPLAVFDPHGFTCCQQADLANRTSQLSERIDLVFVRHARPFLPLAVVTGQIPLFPLFRPPNWASDHGGVFATLVFSN